MTRFASLSFKLLAVSLIAFALCLLAFPLTDRLFRWFAVYLRWLPRRDSPKRAREHLLWALGFASLPLLLLLTLWHFLHIHEAMGWYIAVAIDVFVVGWLLAGYGLGCISLLQPARFERSVSLILAAAALTGTVLFFFPLLDGDRAQRILSTASLPTFPIHALRSLWDRDGDGASPFFGGGDCDDSNPAIAPFALDLPGNGIDEDCSGRDAERLPISHAARRLKRSLWPEGLPRPLNIVLLSAEAFRSDALELAGGKAENIASFAAGATYFSRAYSPGPATHLSFASLFSGRYPSRLRWNLKKRPYQLVSKFRSFVPLLRRRGYHTHADVSCWIRGRFDVVKKGFDEFTCSTKKDGLAALFAGGKGGGSSSLMAPFFLWAHFVEPHGPHGSGTEARIKRRYGGKILKLDLAFGAVLRALRERSDWDRTAVVLTGDHAEALGEHGVATHGVTIYDSEVHIPLWIRVPGLEPRVRDEPVSLVDLGPTFMDLLDLRWRQKVDGISLVPALLGKPPEHRLLFVESYNRVVPPTKWLAVYFENFKLMRRFHEARDELYDLEKDPGETTDLIARGLSIGELLRSEASYFAADSTWRDE